MSGPDDVQRRLCAVLRPVNGMVVPPDVAALLARWLGDYAQFRRQPGQSGVPMFLLETQRVFAEFAASSRRAEVYRSPGAEVLLSGYEPEVGTGEAAAALGCSVDNVRWHVRQRNLVGRKVGRQLMITVASLDNLKLQRAERKGA